MGFARIDATVVGWLSAVAFLGLFTAPALALLHAGNRPGPVVRLAVTRSLLAIPLLALEWWVAGHALAFGPGLFGALARTPHAHPAATGSELHAPFGLVAFRLAFALVLPALVASVCAGRMRFVAFAAFVVAWSTAVLAPVAHWVWGEGGWLAAAGVLDFAGGTVVHLTAGVAILVCSLVLGRSDDESHATRGRASPAAFPWVGAVLLWAAYSAFNCAAGLPNGQLASFALARTELAAVAGGLGWLIVQWRDRGRFDRAGAASGVVAGLVAIAPAAGFVSASAAVAIGFIGGAVSYGTLFGGLAGLTAALLAITADAGYVAPATAVSLAAVAGGFCLGVVLLYERFGLARLPSAFGTHAVAGLAGALLTGVFAQKALNEHGANGALFGRAEQAEIQLLACAAIATYAAAMTYVLLKFIDVTIGLRGAFEAPPRVPDDASEGCEITGVRERRPGAARIASL
ncbi:MAG TPA: hypothetical protein VK841_11445 [Polyangiaceae bacterium]|jgi:Amt family ammonium transporter|nr:hypothetical protein [Polyangiaceae bacterium]